MPRRRRPWRAFEPSGLTDRATARRTRGAGSHRAAAQAAARRERRRWRSTGSRGRADATAALTMRRGLQALLRRGLCWSVGLPRARTRLDLARACCRGRCRRSPGSASLVAGSAVLREVYGPRQPNELRAGVRTLRRRCQQPRGTVAHRRCCGSTGLGSSSPDRVACSEPRPPGDPTDRRRREPRAPRFGGRPQEEAAAQRLLARERLPAWRLTHTRLVASQVAFSLRVAGRAVMPPRQNFWNFSSLAAGAFAWLDAALDALRSISTAKGLPLSHLNGAAQPRREHAATAGGLAGLRHGRYRAIETGGPRAQTRRAPLSFPWPAASASLPP